METYLKIGSDCSGVGSFPQAIRRLGLKYEETFSCDFDFYARQTYLLNFGTEEDIILSKSKEHKYYCDKVKNIALKTKSEPTEEEENILLEANEFAKKFSFYYPFNMYQREIPNEPNDIYVGSFPCQSFSLAGKRKGQEDKRGILFYNGHEFIQKNKPRFFIIENVKGLLSDDSGKTFQRWIDFLGGKSVNGNPVIFPHEEAAPYHVYHQVLNAKNYGIPQNRERIFIIGIRDDADNTFSFPKPFPLEKRLKDVLESEVDEKYFLSDKMVKGLINTEHLNSNRINNTLRVGGQGSLTKKHSFDIVKVGHINQDTQASQVYSEYGITPNICAGTHGYANGYVETKIGTCITHEDGRGFRATEDNNCPTIPARAREDGSGQPVIKVVAFGRSEEEKLRRKKVFQETGKDSGSFKDKNLILKDQEYYDTLLASPNPQKEGLIMVPTNNSKGYDIAEEEEEDSINFSNPNSETRRGRVGHKVSKTLDTTCNQGVYTQQKIRRLTPLEAFRLMDFNFGILGVKDFVWKVSDSQAYKQAGNSICVGVLVEIIKRLKL